MINEYILCNVAFTGILYLVSVVLTVSPIRMLQCRLLCVYFFFQIYIDWDAALILYSVFLE